MTRTNRLDFGSVLDPDPADQWDTKRKLFRLAEVRALPRGVLVLNASEHFVTMPWSSSCPD